MGVVLRFKKPVVFRQCPCGCDYYTADCFCGGVESLRTYQDSYTCNCMECGRVYIRSELAKHFPIQYITRIDEDGDAAA